MAGAGDLGAPAVAAAGGEVLDRVRALRAIAAMDERGMLEDLALVSQQPTYAFAAWRRLGELPWLGGTLR